MERLLVSPSPHLHSSTSTKVLMRDVVIALLPAVLVSVVFYGWKEILVIATAVISCVLVEHLTCRFLLKTRSSVCDLSAVVTGLLLALNLPSTTPWWVVLIGSIVAIGVAKMTFGGLGQNVFNPALVGRVFLLISFPSIMTHWEIPQGIFGIDAVTGSTPLGVIKEGLLQGGSVNELLAESGYSWSDLIFANIGGTAGEVSAVAILVGFIYLLVRKVIKPWITLSIIGTVAVLSAIFWAVDPAQFTPPLFNILSGGLLLGACFMATDYVTSPMSVKGGIVFGVGIGFITLMIRYFGSYPEGVSFAILIMNSTVPLLDRAFHQKKFGRA